MKTKLLPLILFTVIATAKAQFSTPNSGVNWSLDDIALASPNTVSISEGQYILHENLIIESNDTVSLEGILTLKIAPNVEVEIKGHFISNGEEISITAEDTENPYKGFWFYEDSKAYFKNTSITYGGGLRVITPFFEMYDCEVSNNTSGSSTGAAISFSNGSPIIKNSIFKYNVNPALSSAANASVSALIEGNYFEGNNTTNNNRPQINMGPSGDLDSIRIINNTVIGDRNLTMVGGIASASLVGLPNKILIKGNTVKDNRYGITVYGNSDGFIENNIIEDNDTEVNPMNGGSGISLYSTNLVYITNNQIRRNLWGITLIGTSTANLGSMDEEDFNSGGNVFSENGNGGEIYALYNNTPNTIKALNNCWIEGQESTYEDVEAVISHVVDDPGLGEVLFDPFECGIHMNVNDLNQNDFKIYPNPTKNSFFVISKEKGNLSIYDLNGKKLISQKDVNGGSQIHFNLPKGIYLVKFEGVNSDYTKKLIVE